MQDIHIRDELALEAHPDGRYMLVSREGEPGSVRIDVNEVRYLTGSLFQWLHRSQGTWLGMTTGI